MPKYVVRSAFDYDSDAVSLETGIACDPEEGKTQQQFADECDINKIVERFGVTGMLPQSNMEAMVGAFEGVTDFHAAMNLVRESELEFMKLSGEVRARFANDPGAVLAFLEDEKNRDEAVKLGLIPAPVEVPRSE